MGKKTALGRIEPYGGPERRAHTRFNVEVRVQVAELGTLKGFLTRDVSEGGMLLDTQKPRKIGSALAVTLIHPASGDELSVITTVVRHVKNTEGHLLGLGLKFQEFDEALRRRLRLLLRDVSPSVPDLVEKRREQPIDPRAEPTQPPPSAQTGSPDVAPTLEPSIEPRVDPPVEPAATPPGPSQPPPSAQVAPIEMDAPSEPIEIPAVTAPATEPSIPMTAVPVMIAMKEHLEPMLLHLVLNVNGRNSVEEITRKTGLRVSETLTGLGQLLDRGIITIPDIRDTIESPAPDEKLDDAQVQAAQTFATTRAEDYVKQADEAERGGHTAESIRLLQLALTVGPHNPLPIHTRLARLALYKLLDVELAEHHCIAGLAVDAGSEPLRKMLEELRSLQKETVGKRTRETNLADVEDGPTATRKSSGLGVVILISALMVVVALMVTTIVIVIRT